MSLDVLLFWILAAGTALGASGVAVSRHPLHAAVCLAATLVSLGGIYGLLGAVLPALVQIIAYAGAVVVLIVLVVMMLNRGRDPVPVGTAGLGLAAAGISAGLVGLAGVALRGTVLVATTQAPPTAADLGRALFGGPGGLWVALIAATLALLTALPVAWLLAGRSPRTRAEEAP